MTKQRPVDATTKRPRVFGFSLTFFRNTAIRRMFNAFGTPVRFGWPTAQDRVLVWGRTRTSLRGIRIAQKTKARLTIAEDGFLRSVRTGRGGDDPHSVILDQQGIYFEASKPNDLRDLLILGPKLSQRGVTDARASISFLRENHLSKYNDFTLDAPDLPPEFVLLIDQTRHDASVTGAGADEGTFQRMLETALAENPNAKIVIKTHPETQAKQRRGYFDAKDASDRVILYSKAVSPWAIMAQAKKVYCVSSTMGMEAIFAGHTPIVFGCAFYSGMGLTDDRHVAVVPIGPRSAEQLFYAAYIKYCHWYDPFRDEASDFSATALTLETQAAFRRKHQKPQIFVGMRLWKRGFLKRFFKDAAKPPLFIDDPDKAVKAAVRDGADVMVWSGKETVELAERCKRDDVTLYRVEDGFLRSAGLGASLIEPVSLALDDLGIYYDPTRESRLEGLIARSLGLPEHALQRAETIKDRMIALKLSKYNLRSVISEIPSGTHTVLIPGQVEDDQSILKGAGKVKTNLDLVKATRDAFPDSYLIYKPHPDVTAGLRNGGSATDQIAEITNKVLFDADITDLLDRIDCVSTITSLTGFEALLRGKSVTCFGTPFYAGWGLTDDRGGVPERRQAKPSLLGLIHATLIDYPYYWDPVTGAPCKIETILDRFEDGRVQRNGRGSIRWLAKAQGLFASYAHFWR
jgi:capsular polysaccharide export protein